MASLDRMPVELRNETQLPSQQWQHTCLGIRIKPTLKEAGARIVLTDMSNAAATEQSMYSSKRVLCNMACLLGKKQVHRFFFLA